MDNRTQRERDRSNSGYPPRAALADAWDEHSRYVGFAAGLFAVGIVVGIALMIAGYNLLEIIQEVVGEPLFPDISDRSRLELAQFLLVNNSRAFLLSILGVLTLGLLTAWAMVFNGIIVGNVGAFIAGSVGVGYILVGLLPHGIFELPALFIAAGVGFRLLYRVGQRIRGSRSSIITKRYLYRTGLLVLAGWLLLVVAAVVEAFVTPALLETLFADRLEAMGSSP
ncbi:stage II sporulation protein M [Haloterrigena sp. H1]|uniref:stage II sporulation protein M n=2 Tax=Haloterrigena sp. H1 TaxID=2552943 RepID=UPI00110D93D9|nr:stage II sporulation protein M [Haloterrigena sp. H1]TMT77916.1 stage II sporulation protein M [Haloterrigena sp. H1]TMT80407.1 stage II sporulation protein M [Haloterrigena sp. H1]